MKRIVRRRVGILALVVAMSAPAARAVEVFDYCLDHPDQCSLSIHHVTEGWERHLNADRLQVTASTFKVLALIVYAHAVVDGRIDPELEVPVDEWARFWVGRDGGALEAAWNRLGQPNAVTVEQMMGAMIRESDNAAPDWLLGELGSRYFKRTLACCVDGYHDTPASIAATFLSWGGHPEDPDFGPRLLEIYSGQEALGYVQEVGALFKRLAGEGFVQASRDLACAAPPWDPQPSGCSPEFGNATEAEIRELLGGYFLQSNARTYSRLLVGILDGTMLTPAVQEVVVRVLEFPLEDPGAADVVTRIGMKGGSLAPQNVCNWVAYAELRDTGEQAIVSIFVQDLPLTRTCNALRLEELLEAMLFEEGFKVEVQDRLPEETPRPELIARLEKLKRKVNANGEKLTVRLRVSNIGPADVTAPFEVWLVRSSDRKPQPKDEVLEKLVVQSLGAGQSKKLRFKRGGLEGVEGDFLFVRVDRRNVIDESVEDNDRPWQVIP